VASETRRRAHAIVRAVAPGADPQFVPISCV
jgi:hypothetical protein